MGVLYGMINGKEIRIEARPDGEIILEGNQRVTSIMRTAEGRYSVLINGRSVSVCVSRSFGDGLFLVNGKPVSVVLESERTRLLRTLEKSGGDHRKPIDIRAPMPALVSSIPVAPGDVVRAGQGLVVLEAMKMENEIRAHSDGTVTGIFVKKGETVEKGTLLLRVEAGSK